MSIESTVQAVGTEPARLFIAIPVPEEIRAALSHVQGEMRERLSPASAAWIKPDNLHLTLRFLGNVGSSRISGLTDKLGNAVAGFGELRLICEQLGCFPDLRYPRVLWSSVHDREDGLPRLFRQIDAAVTEFAGKPAEKHFTGHVTLARLKQLKQRETEVLANLVKAAVNRRFGEWTARSVSLIQSQLSQSGATYTERCHVALC